MYMYTYVYIYVSKCECHCKYIYIITQPTPKFAKHTRSEQVDRDVNIPPTQTAQHLKKSKQSGFVTSCLGTALGAKIVVTFLSFLGCYIFPPTFPVPHHQYRLHRLRQWSNSPMVHAENSLVPRREISIAST